MRRITYLLSALIFVDSILFFGCGQSGSKKEEPVSIEVKNNPTEKKYKKYEEYSYDEFCILPHDVQYSIKFPNDVDTIISVEYHWIDTIYSENGTPLEMKKGLRTCNLVLEKDTMRLFYPYLAKPQLNFFTFKKLYDKRNDEFSDFFHFDFKYDKKKKYYYITKTEFPEGITFNHDDPQPMETPVILDLLPTEKKYEKLRKELIQDSYFFSESHYDKRTYDWVNEENEITKFENWLNRN